MNDDQALALRLYLLALVGIAFWCVVLLQAF